MTSSHCKNIPLIFTHFRNKVTKLEANQNKYNCLVSKIYNKLKSRALFSHLVRTEKSAGKINLLKKLLTRQFFLFWFPSKRTDRTYKTDSGLTVFLVSLLKHTLDAKMVQLSRFFVTKYFAKITLNIKIVWKLISEGVIE